LGTAASPSLPSIARQGEWSLGAVLDVYWHFASIGDHYLGRILAGLDPSTPDFGTLPPHWTTSNPLENDLVKRAMVMLYGPILVAYEGRPENSAGLLLRCLSSLVFHSNALLEVMVKFPGHDFTKIYILHDRELLEGLKKLVTTDRTPGVMTMATGIPPRVGTAQQLAKILNVMTELVQKFGEHGDNLMVAVEEALDTKAWELGHVTGSRLKGILENFQKNGVEAVDSRLEGLRVEFNWAISRGDLEVHPTRARQNQGVQRGAPSSMFSYGGQFLFRAREFFISKSPTTRSHSFLAERTDHVTGWSGKGATVHEA
jgi:hypothetical protein